MNNLEKILKEFEDEFEKRFGDFEANYHLGKVKDIRNFIAKVYAQAHEAGRQEAIEERDGYWKTLMENVCTVGCNFPARCYECGEKHASGMSWEEAYKANALFGKCFQCVSKEAVALSSLKDKSITPIEEIPQMKGTQDALENLTIRKL